MHVLTMLYPNWRKLAIHESSPVPRGASLKMKNECAGYVFSQYDEELEFGRVHAEKGYRSEDLEKQTFESGIFDIVVTQDVFEHLFDPVAAAREIMRTLKPGGAHIFSVPIVRKSRPSMRRAEKIGSGVTHILEPQYHGNPMSSKGALVTIDWGYDILDILSKSGHPHSLFHIDNIELGIRAELIEILVGRKSLASPHF